MIQNRLAVDLLYRVDEAVERLRGTEVDLAEIGRRRGNFVGMAQEEEGLGEVAEGHRRG